MNENYRKLLNEAGKADKSIKQMLARLPEKQAIKQLPHLHEKAFAEIDCLQCANCCKNHSPTFKTTDIRRISKFLGMKESQFIETYLQLDEDNDFVLKRTPCSFLQSDNRCSIYEVRPGDCANYPYTDSDIFIKRKNLTLRNSTVCPAVVKVLEGLRVKGIG